MDDRLAIDKSQHHRQTVRKMIGICSENHDPFFGGIVRKPLKIGSPSSMQDQKIMPVLRLIFDRRSENMQRELDRSSQKGFPGKNRLGTRLQFLDFFLCGSLLEHDTKPERIGGRDG